MMTSPAISRRELRRRASHGLTVAEIGHGIHRANTLELRDRRRRFLDDLKAAVPIYPVTEFTAEFVARIGGERYAIGTGNLRDFRRIPGLKIIRF